MPEPMPRRDVLAKLLALGLIDRGDGITTKGRRLLERHPDHDARKAERAWAVFTGRAKE